jgi:hypothetical protein
MVIGQNLTQRRKGAKKTVETQMVAVFTTVSEAFFSKTPLRLSALA